MGYDFSNKQLNAASGILNQYYNTARRKGHLFGADRPEIEKQFKDNTSIFSQKSNNFYDHIGVKNEDEYKKLLGSIDKNNDGIVSIKEAAELAKVLGSDKKIAGTDEDLAEYNRAAGMSRGYVKEKTMSKKDIAEKKSKLSKVLDFVMGAVATNGTSMKELTKIDNQTFFAGKDKKTGADLLTRGQLKEGNSFDKIAGFGKKLVDKKAKGEKVWDGTQNNNDYALYSNVKPEDINKEINKAFSQQGTISTKNIKNYPVLEQLFKERNLKKDDFNTNYQETSDKDRFNATFWDMSGGTGKITKKDFEDYVKKHPELKKALGISTGESIVPVVKPGEYSIVPVDDNSVKPGEYTISERKRIGA